MYRCPYLARFCQGTMRWAQGSISWHLRFILSSVLKHQTRAPLSQTIRDGGCYQRMCTTISPLGLWCHTGLVVVHRCLCRIGLLILFLFWNLAWCFLVPWKLVLREESLISDAAWIFQGLRPRYMVSSSIETYLQPLGGNQWQRHHWRFGSNKNSSYTAMQLAGIVWKSNSDYKILSVPRYITYLRLFPQEVWFPNGYQYNRHCEKAPSSPYGNGKDKNNDMVLPERKLLHLKDGLSFQGPVLPLALCKPGFCLLLYMDRNRRSSVCWSNYC